MTWMASQARIMGELAIGRSLRIGGWIATAVVAASVLAMAIAAALEFVR